MTHTTPLPFHLPPANPALAHFDELLRGGLDARALRLASEYADQHAVWSELSQLASRQAWLINARPMFGRLAMIPVIRQQEQAHDAGELTLEHIGRDVQHALTRRGGGVQVRSLHTTLRPYVWVASWSPTILHSQAVAIIHPPTPKALHFTAPLIELPRAAPALSFICLGLTSTRGWPAVSPLDTGDWEAVARLLRADLQLFQGDHVRVLPPSLVQTAITDGLRAWLHALDAEFEIGQWAVEPLADPVDALRFAVRLERPGAKQPMWTSFVVRKHQIGLRGVNELTLTLSAMTEMVPAEVTH